jgi:hypothetical protein
VVEMRVTSVMPRASSAAVEVETAMRPERDTGGTFWKSLISGCPADGAPSSLFEHYSCVGRTQTIAQTAVSAVQGLKGVDFFS